MNKPQEHFVKTWPEFFEPISSGAKTAEFRLNDRNYQLGDKIVHEEYDPNSRRYSGRKAITLVTHIVYGGVCGIPEGYCVMSIALA